MLTYVNNAKSIYNTVSEMTFYQTKLQMISDQYYSNNKQIETVIRTRQFINKNYAMNIDLDSLSSIHCTSKFHLLRLFKRYYGQTPKQYLTYKRLEKARILLKSGRTISQTCFEVGFDSPCSFSTLFKRYTGRTPSEYRKEQLSQSRCG